MSQIKKRIRREYREAVLARDGYCCLGCGKPGRDRCGGDKHVAWHTGNIPAHTPLVELDAHHITPRNEIDNGGYVPENGISLCSACHKAVEAKDAANPKRTRQLLYGKIASSLLLAEAEAKRLGQRFGMNPPKAKPFRPKRLAH